MEGGSRSRLPFVPEPRTSQIRRHLNPDPSELERKSTLADLRDPFSVCLGPYLPTLKRPFAGPSKAPLSYTEMCSSALLFFPTVIASVGCLNSRL
jgi:hypothetical protein